MSSTTKFQSYVVKNFTCKTVSLDNIFHQINNYHQLITVAQNIKLSNVHLFDFSMACIGNQNYNRGYANQDDFQNNVFINLKHLNDINIDVIFRCTFIISNEKTFTKEYKYSFDKTNSYFSTNFFKQQDFTNKIVPGSTSPKKLQILLEISEIEDFSDSKSNMLVAFQSILESGKFADMSFIVKGKELRAHKTIICARSPVFAAMFSNEFKENKENKVIISDVSVEAFEKLLRFLYTNEIKQMDKHTKELLMAADKYQIDDLTSNIVQLIINATTVNTVVDMLLMADQCNIEQLKSRCSEFIVLNLKEVMKTESWKKLNSRSIKTDLVGICNALAKIQI